MPKINYNNPIKWHMPQRKRGARICPIEMELDPQAREWEREEARADARLGRRATDPPDLEPDASTAPGAGVCRAANLAQTVRARSAGIRR